jgi:hypothetical protein
MIAEQYVKGLTAYKNTLIAVKNFFSSFKEITDEVNSIIELCDKLIEIYTPIPVTDRYNVMADLDGDARLNYYVSDMPEIKGATFKEYLLTIKKDSTKEQQRDFWAYFGFKYLFNYKTKEIKVVETLWLKTY